jgi:hypothetical protein
VDFKLREWLGQQPAARTGDDAVAAALREVAEGLSRLSREAVPPPARPLPLGVAKLAFICEHEQAHYLAARALVTFEQSDIPALGRLSARCGVAIIPRQASLLRGYQQAGRKTEESRP